MRIEPEQQAAARLRPVNDGPREDRGFASALAAVRDANAQSGPDPALAKDPGDPAGQSGGRNPNLPVGPPLAERWGQYGPGATAAGYGTAPDPALFAHHPIGANEPAHPLNPEGNTYQAPFTVPGHTGRGTPIPPGFYNLAYYNRYLAEGGTPLEGFPGYTTASGSLAETYGAFGDGRARATSFIPGGGPGELAAIAEPEAPGPASGDVAVTRDADSITAATVEPREAPGDEGEPAAARPAEATPAPAAPEPEVEIALGPRSADLALADAGDVILAEAARQAARAGILALLDEILSA